MKNILNNFGPWTADVHHPLLKSRVLNVITTALNGHPVKKRGAGILACWLPHRPGACPFLPRAQSQPFWPHAPFLSPYIVLNRPIEIMNAVPKGKIGRLLIRFILAFGRKTANRIGMQGESGMQNAELHLAAKKFNLAG